MIHVVVEPKAIRRTVATRNQVGQPNTVNQATPATNILETAEGWVLHIAAPGLSREGFQLKAEKNHLTLSAEYPKPSEENTKVLRREFGYGTISRSFQLPENADGGNIRAQYEAGVLRVFIPKKAPLQIRID